MRNRSAGKQVDYKLAIKEIKDTEFSEHYRRVIEAVYKERFQGIKLKLLKQKNTLIDKAILLDLLINLNTNTNKTVEEYKDPLYQDMITEVANCLGYNVAGILVIRENGKFLISCMESKKTNHSEPLALQNVIIKKMIPQWKDLGEKLPPPGAAGAARSGAGSAGASRGGAGATASSSMGVEVKTDTIKAKDRWGYLDPKIQKDIQDNRRFIDNLLARDGSIFLYTERKPCEGCQKMLQEMFRENWQEKVYYSVPNDPTSVESIRRGLIGALEKEIELDRRAALAAAAPPKEMGAGAAGPATEVKKTFAAGETTTLEQPSSLLAEAAPLSRLEGGAGAAGPTTRAKTPTAGEDSESEGYSSPQPLTPLGSDSYIPDPFAGTERGTGAGAETIRLTSGASQATPVVSTNTSSSVPSAGSETPFNLPLTAASPVSKEQPKTAQVAAPAARMIPQATQAASGSLNSRSNPKRVVSSSAPAKNIMRGSEGSASSPQGAGSTGLSLFSAPKPKASQKRQEPKKPEPKKP